jgi:hypothetical protein
MPTTVTINRSEQQRVENQLVANGLAKDIGHGWSFSRDLIKSGIKKRPRMVDPNLGFSVGFEGHRLKEAIKRHPKTTAGVAGVGAGLVGAGYLAGKRKGKKKTTNNEVLINHSEQQRVERQMLINQLSQNYQPVEMIDNASIGKMVKGGKAMARRGFKRLSSGVQSFKTGSEVGTKYGAKARKGIGKSSTPASYKAGVIFGSTAGRAGKAAAIQAKRAGLRAKKFAKSPAGKMTGVGAAAAGGAAFGSTVSSRARRKKARNDY